MDGGGQKRREKIIVKGTAREETWDMEPGPSNRQQGGRGRGRGVRITARRTNYEEMELGQQVGVGGGEGQTPQDQTQTVKLHRALAVSLVN